MLNKNALKGAIVTKGLTQEDVAIILGVSRKTFSEKLRKGVFLSSEIGAMMKLLDIEDPRGIFFADDVAQ